VVWWEGREEKKEKICSRMMASMEEGELESTDLGHDRHISKDKSGFDKFYGII
jgi:hypothetical protein